MRISRLEEMVAQGDGEDADQRLGEPSAADQRLGAASAEGNQRLGDASVEGGTRAESFLVSESVRMVVVIDEEMAEHAESPGWSLSTSMLPVHLAYNMSTTVDPSARFNPDEWPHRSTLIWKRGREYEVFECGEYWEPNRTLDLDAADAPARQLLTILTKDPIEPEFVRHELKRVAKVESKSTLQAIRQVILSACVLMEATRAAEGHSLTAFHVGSQGVTCLDSIKHMALMNVDKASVSVVAILVFLPLVMTLVLYLADLKFLRPPIQRHLRLDSRLLLNVVILILTMTVPVRASASGDQNEDDTFLPEAGYLQSRRKSWQNGFGSTTVINEMVMMLPQPIEATSSWLILVLLMVCVLTAMLTSYWTTVKDMLKKFPCGEPSSTQTNENDLATVMTDNSDLGATVMSSPTTSPPRSPRNQRRDQESETGFEVVNDLVEGGEEREDPQPNPGGDVAGPGVDDAVRDRLYEWMEENIAAPSSYDGPTDSTSFDKTSAGPASSIGAPTNSSRTNWPASCARASLRVPHWTSLSPTHMWHGTQ